MDRDFVREIGGLQANADAIFQRLLLFVGIETEHGDIAAGARAQAFEDLDCGGFPGAVRAEQAEDLAGLYLEIDALHCFVRAVGFAQTARGNGRDRS